MAQYNGPNHDNAEWRRISAFVTRPGSRCVRCGATGNLHAHHVVPRAFGGTDDLSNLVPACARCHPTLEPRRAPLTRLAQKLVDAGRLPPRSPAPTSLREALRRAPLD